MNLNYDKKVKFYTLGCKVNQYETEASMEIFENEGYSVVEGNNPADVYVINTCTVTSLSDSKSRQIIRKSKRENPESTMIVMGCYSQVSSKEVEDIEGVDIVIGTTERSKIVDLVNEYRDKREKINIVRDIKKDKFFQPIDIKKIKNMTRAYIKVQDGCNRYCSYCIIPYARGNIRSRDPIDVKNEVIKLASNNYKEIILTGIHIASYGKDLEDFSLIDLIKSIHDVDGIKRIRLSSVEPRLITEEFLNELIKLPKFCDHFHLSLQSGSDTVLKRMNRKYTSKEYIEKVNLIRSYYKDAGITTDIIVGFPGESEDEYRETVELVKEVGFSRVHVFKYSPRKGTPAAKMPDQIHGDIKNFRSKDLIDLTDNLREHFERSFINKTVPILVERKSKDLYIGHSTNYMEIAFKSNKDYTNTIVNVIIDDYKDGTLIGTLKGEYDD